MNNFYFYSINQFFFLLNSRNAVCILAVLMAGI